MKWKHLPCYRPFVRGIHRSPVDSPHKGHWRGTLMFSLIWAWTNDWANNEDAGDLRHHRVHYDVTVMVEDKTPRVSGVITTTYSCCLRRQFINNHTIDLLFNDYSSFITKRFTLITLWYMNACFIKVRKSSEVMSTYSCMNPYNLVH